MNHHSIAGVSLPEDVWWTDEFEWSPLDQATEYTVTGALIIDEAERQSGRPITLQSNPRGGWVSRGTVKALRALADTPATPYPLTLADGRTFDVRFDLTRPFEATPVRPHAGMTDATHYRITLRLIEV